MPSVTGAMLGFYSTDGMATHFTAFAIPQPIWTHSGYVVLYAIAAIFLSRALWLGSLTRNGVYPFAGVEFLMSCTFEMIGINGNGYAYWGPHVFRILNYPLAIGVLESAQVVVFAVAATVLRRCVSHPAGLLGLFVLFPCTFFGVNFGAGWPMIIALHLGDPATWSASTRPVFCRVPTRVGRVRRTCLPVVVSGSASAAISRCSSR